MLASRTTVAIMAEVSSMQAMHTGLGDAALNSGVALGACGRTPQLCAGCTIAGKSNSHTHARARGDGRRSDWKISNTRLLSLMQKKASMAAYSKMPQSDPDFTIATPLGCITGV
jgi:hypothetical protein